MRSIKDIFLIERDAPENVEELKIYLQFKGLLNKRTPIQLHIKDDDSNITKQKTVSITYESLINYYFFYNKFIDTTSFEKEIYDLSDEFLNNENSSDTLAAGNYSRLKLNMLIENDDDESIDSDDAIKTMIAQSSINISPNVNKEKTGIVKKVVNSSSPGEFSRNLFYYLYKKLIDNNSIITDFNFEVELENVVTAFKDSLKKNQASLTVNFGQLFEEIFRKKVFNILERSNEFVIDLKHDSKKIAIILLYCCNERFKSESNNKSTVYMKISGGNKPVDSDYVVDYNNLTFHDKIGLEAKTRKIIESYRDLLDIQDNSSLYCNDAEKDEIFNAPSNSPFDFSIRHNDLNQNGNIGFFDLKAHNTFTKGSSCLVKGATGSNGGTLNSALTFINNMLDKAKLKNKESTILFFGLIQISFELDFNSSTSHDIIINDVGDRIANAMSSTQYSLNKNDFYLSNDPLNKTSVSLLSRESYTPNAELGISANLEFDSIRQTRKLSYRDKIKETLDIIYNNKSTIQDYFQNQEISVICSVSTKLQILFDPDYFVEINAIKLEPVGNDTITSFNKFRSDSSFDCSKIFEILYDRIFAGQVEIQRKRTLSNILIEIFNGSNKIENYNECKSYLEANECMFNENLRINADTSFASFIDKLANAQLTSRTQKIEFIKKKLIEKVNNEILKADRELPHSLFSTASPTINNLFYQRQASTFESVIRKNKTLKEVFSYLFKKKVNLTEGALGGHMMHPYEALDMTPNQLISRIKQYGIPQKLIEKVDGQNLFFTVNIDGTLLFARNKEDMTHQDLVDKFTGHPAEKPFIEGGNAIKKGVEFLLSSIDHEEVIRLFHPSEGITSFVNFEIMHPEKPNQIIYDEKYIVFHSIVDYRNGREEVSRSNQDQRIHELISLMNSGVTSAGFVLASNREVDLNQLTDIQISEYIDKLYEITSMLGMEEGETLGDGIMNVINDEISAVGVTLSDEALTIFTDYVIRGEDSAGRKIASKDWTKFLSKEDITKLRKLGLTSIEKVKSKIGQILQPFKGLFVELGIDLLKGVKSSYMSDEMNIENVSSIRDKLRTAIYDLQNYINTVPEDEWPKSVSRLIPHMELINRKGLDNIVSSSVEGGVYNVDDSLFKVTGGFAPMNQIIGAAYRDKEGIFTTFKEKFIKTESINSTKKKSIKEVFLTCTSS